jgi:hypothetical protein
MAVVCPRCDKSYCSKSGLRRHLRTVRSCSQLWGDTRRCRLCEKTFGDSQLLASHLAKHAVPVARAVIRCIWCSRTLASERALDRHCRESPDCGEVYLYTCRAAAGPRRSRRRRKVARLSQSPPRPSKKAAALLEAASMARQEAGTAGEPCAALAESQRPMPPVPLADTPAVPGRDENADAAGPASDQILTRAGGRYEVFPLREAIARFASGEVDAMHRIALGAMGPAQWDALAPEARAALLAQASQPG